MLTTEQIRKVAAQSGARDIEKVEIDIILTHLLQLFHEKGITEHVAFKGGTMLRKMIFGPRGRYSTDLDFTLRSEATDEQVMGMVLDALGESYHGISFKIDDKDWDFTDNSFFANPACSHAGNEKGIKIKIQVSLREKPVLPVRALPQLKLILRPACVCACGYSLPCPRGSAVRENPRCLAAFQNPRPSRSLASGEHEVRPRTHKIARRHQAVGERQGQSRLR
jgi:hypothetical protein